jgi:photosystem II stability/assembly factor-like uncharacterized protein
VALARCLRSRTWMVTTFLLAFACLHPAAVAGRQYSHRLYSGMRWRLVGPFRGGRALTACGVPGKPDTFYFGAVGGGVWETDDAGRVWTPIFDHEPIASIGALAVAPSNPKIIYVGSGEADMRSDISYGNGMYKSTDAGRTWQHIGLDDTQQIGKVLVDPRSPNIVFVAALGHAYGANPERGVFRSLDGGRTWKKVLYKNADTGAIDLAFDSRNPQVIYAALWQTRRPPWGVYPPSNGPGSGLYKSTDGGNTWKHLTGHGLPSQGLGRIGIAVAPSNPHRVYLIVDARKGGLYRSDNSGQAWKLINSETRLWGRGWYFGGVTVDPQDENTVYISNTALYRSSNGGKSFIVLKASPGGDDYHSLWIDPKNSNRMITASDQGVVISMNGGRTWSSWYNQPTAQLYHIVTDNRYPYWIYGSQQDSGSLAILSRSPYRGINMFSWRPIEPGGESEYIAPDPLHPNIVFGGSSDTGVTKYNLVTHQNQDVTPTLAHLGVYRSTWTLPLVFSPTDPHLLYFGTQKLFDTTDGGKTWRIASPDLTRKDPGVPKNLDPITTTDFTGNGRRGVIYTIAPSPVEHGEVWIGTDDGLIQLTHDGGKTWQNVTPPAITPWSKISMIEASHFDANTAYAAVDRHRLDDFRAHIYRTHDGGKTWQEVSHGIPDGSFVRVVREDPKRRGLLYAGTETGVFVSFDDGEHWESLQQNLPNASVRDLVVHGNDLIAGTHGRSIWILDDVTPLRQMDPEVAASNAWLFRPATAYRSRFGSTDEGTPLPPEESAGKNPPNGAILDYYLRSKPVGPVIIEILDSNGKLVRRYSSTEESAKSNSAEETVAPVWVHHAQPPSAEPGMHRFVWNLLYPAPAAPFGFDLWTKSGMWAVPGHYTVKLMVDGKTHSQPLTVVMDPRIQVSQANLELQFETDQQIVSARERVSKALAQAENLQRQLRSLLPQTKNRGELTREIKAIHQKLSPVLGPEPQSSPDYSGEFGPSEDLTSLRYLAGALGELEYVVESADAAPTPDAIKAFHQRQQVMESTFDAWQEIKLKDMPLLNSLLRQAKLPAISIEKSTERPR